MYSSTEEVSYRKSGFIKSRNDVAKLDYMSFGAFTLSFAGSAVALGLGTWILVERNYFSIILHQDTMTASAWLFALAGLLGVLAAIYGYVVANMKNVLLMYIFNGVQALIFLMLLLSFILAIVYKAHINRTPDKIWVKMTNVIQNEYGVDLDNYWNRRITTAWDETQEKLYCCSIHDESWRTYENSAWHVEQPPDPNLFIKPYVPISCCVKRLDDTYVDREKCQTFQYGPPGFPNLDGPNEGLNYRGCFEAAKDLGNEITNILIGTSICIAILTILPALLYGMYLALFGIPDLIRLDEKYKKDRQSMMSAGGAFTDMYGYS